jgi:hypothetical protein
MEDKYAIYTYCTHSQFYFDGLINNKFNKEVKVLGWGEKWINYVHKLKKLYEEFKKLEPEFVVIIVDGFDTIINKDPDEAYNIYMEKYSDKVLVAKDITTDNFFIKYFLKKAFFSSTPINSGLMMGKVKYILDLFDKIKYYPDMKNDQRFFNLYTDEYNIDVNNVIFKHLNFEEREYSVENFDSIFIQIPGIVEFNKFINGVQDYIEYLIDDIIIIIVSVIMIIIFIGYVNDYNFKSNQIARYL